MIGKNIAALRKKHRLTQNEFAERIHVTQGAVSQWETGRTNPDTYQLIQIANLFDVDLNSLTGDEPHTVTISANHSGPIVSGRDVQSAVSPPGAKAVGRSVSNSMARGIASIDVGHGEANVVYTNHNPQPEIIGSIMDYARKNSDMASIRSADKRSKLKEAFDELVNEMNDEQIQQFDLFIQLMKSRGK